MEKIIEKIKNGLELTCAEQVKMVEALNAKELLEVYVQEFDLYDEAILKMLSLPNAKELWEV